jgi:hypothetical protein
MAATRASGRMIRRSISESRGIAKLSPEAAVLFVMLIPHFNAHGKMPGGPGVVKDEIVPLLPYFSYENLPQYLQEISDKTNVKWFRSGTKWWLHSLNFLSKHQDLNEKRMGTDELPSWVDPEQGQEATTEVPDISQVTEQSGSSPGVVRDFPLRAEGLKVEGLKKEEEPKTQQQRTKVREPTKSEEVFGRCFEANEEKIRRLFPQADIAMEREVCVAYYRSRSPPVDPLPLILKWFQRIRKAGENDGAGFGKNRSERKKTGIIPANGPDADWLGGSQFDTTADGKI